MLPRRGSVGSFSPESRFSLLQLCGAAILGVGIWAKVDGDIGEYITIVNFDDSNPYFSQAVWILIAIGAFIFLVGFLGCCGACYESSCMLALVSFSSASAVQVSYCSSCMVALVWSCWSVQLLNAHFWQFSPGVVYVRTGQHDKMWCPMTVICHPRSCLFCSSTAQLFATFLVLCPIRGSIQATDNHKPSNDTIRQHHQHPIWMEEHAQNQFSPKQSYAKKRMESKPSAINDSNMPSKSREEHPD